MIPTKKQIKHQIERMNAYVQSRTGDDTDQRMVYNAMEILRWSIEDTVGWDKPLEHSLAISEILKQERKNE